MLGRDFGLSAKRADQLRKELGRSRGSVVDWGISPDGQTVWASETAYLPEGYFGADRTGAKKHIIVVGDGESGARSKPNTSARDSSAST